MPDGTTLDPARLRSSIEDWLAESSLNPRDRMNGETERTRAFIRTHITNEIEHFAELLYFSLSADSHGLSIGVNSSLHIDAEATNRLEAVTLRTPRSYVRDLVDDMLHLHGLAHDMVAEFCALPSDVRGEWNEQKIKAYQLCSQAPR
jgi:hypothetical protein